MIAHTELFFVGVERTAQIRNRRAARARLSLKLPRKAVDVHARRAV